MLEKTIERKISFYNELERFHNENIEVTNSITINREFITTLEDNFSDFLRLREKSKRIPHAENENFKNSLTNKFEKVREIKNNNNKPTIYWFEIVNKSNTPNEKLYKKFVSSRKTGAGWWTIGNKNANLSNNILYLGKVEKNLFGRFLQHLGIGHKKTSSLKLMKWFHQFENIDLEFKYIQFDEDILPYLEDFENIYWRHYQPLLGQEPRIK